MEGLSLWKVVVIHVRYSQRCPGGAELEGAEAGDWGLGRHWVGGSGGAWGLRGVNVPVVYASVPKAGLVPKEPEPPFPEALPHAATTTL